MSTEKIFLWDTYATACQSVVTACAQVGEAYEITLNQTVLFPESGGQPADHGWLGAYAIAHVSERGDEVIHHCAQPIAPGEAVVVRVDFARRFEMMQQHTGEHLLAAVAYRLFEANNVGFHLNEQSLGIDFDYFFKEEELRELEAEANRLVWQNHSVIARLITDEEYHNMPMRKKNEHLHGDIRIVEMDGLDTATCCGTHLAATGEIGVIKILSSQRYKGGSRVEFACGVRALRDYEEKNKLIDQLAQAHSVKPHLLGEALQKKEEEAAALARRLRSRTRQLLEYKAKELCATATILGDGELVEGRLEHLTPEEGKELISLLVTAPNRVALLWLVEEERICYLFGKGKDAPGEIKALIALANDQLSGRGGGTPLLCQGSAPLAHWQPVAQAVKAALHQQVQE